MTSGDSKIVEQIRKQLGKLIDTIKVTEMKYGESIQREMVLMKVTSSHETRGEILQIAEIFHCKILQVTPSEMIFETTGDGEKIDTLIELLQPYRISEISRTGKTAICSAWPSKTPHISTNCSKFCSSWSAASERSKRPKMLSFGASERSKY